MSYEQLKTSFIRVGRVSPDEQEFCNTMTALVNGVPAPFSGAAEQPKRADLAEVLGFNIDALTEEQTLQLDAAYTKAVDTERKARAIYAVLQKISERSVDTTDAHKRLMNTYIYICKAALADPAVRQAYEEWAEQKAISKVVLSEGAKPNMPQFGITQVGDNWKLTNARTFSQSLQQANITSLDQLEDFYTAYENALTLYSTERHQAIALEAGSPQQKNQKRQTLKDQIDGEKNKLINFYNNTVTKLYQYAADTHNGTMLTSLQATQELPNLRRTIANHPFVSDELRQIVKQDNFLNNLQAKASEADVSVESYAIGYLHRKLCAEKLQLSDPTSTRYLAIDALIKQIEAYESPAIRKMTRETRELMPMRPLLVDLSLKVKEARSSSIRFKKSRLALEHLEKAINDLLKDPYFPADISSTGVKPERYTGFLQALAEVKKESKGVLAYDVLKAVDKLGAKVVDQAFQLGLGATLGDEFYKTAIDRLEKQNKGGFTELRAAIRKSFDALQAPGANPKSLYKTLINQLITDYQVEAAKPRSAFNRALSREYIDVLGRLLEKSKDAMSETAFAKYFAAKAQARLIQYQHRFGFKPNELKRNWAEYIFTGLNEIIKKMPANDPEGARAAIREMVTFLLTEEAHLGLYVNGWGFKVTGSNELQRVVGELIDDLKDCLPPDLQDYVDLSLGQTKEERAKVGLLQEAKAVLIQRMMGKDAFMAEDDRKAELKESARMKVQAGGYEHKEAIKRKPKHPEDRLLTAKVNATPNPHSPSIAEESYRPGPRARR